MVSPPLLKKGDKVGIVSPAGKVKQEKVFSAIELLKGWGLDVSLGDSSLKSFYQFSGTDVERAFDFQRMLDDKSIKAIFSSRGGYGTIRILDQLDFTQFNKNPKWIIGFSDITALHSYVNNLLHTESIHGAMPSTFPVSRDDNESIKSLKNLLFKGSLSYNLPEYKFNRAGKSKAALIGGNLSILYALSGTRFDLDTSDKILFIEDVNEYLYHLDRMMMNLKLSGKLDQLQGLIVGDFSDMKDNDDPFGKTSSEIIYEYVKKYEYPVAFNFPAGHKDTNLALTLGRDIEFEVNEKGGTIKF